MGDTTVPPEAIRRRLDALDVAVGDGPSAYADLGGALNLNAAAIGLGLDEVTYNPETFPGLVYTPDADDGSVAVVFGNGTLFVGDSQSAEAVVDEVTARLTELGLLSGSSSTGDLSTAPAEVPVPPAYEDTGSEADTDRPTGSDAGDAGAADGPDTAAPGEAPDASEATCPDCGYGLSGDENFCPECGTELHPECPDCGYDLSGSENFCPECGTGLKTS
jgi:RNA polymerase subunit RPABC4/transcription elongation factor Spt4